MYLWNSTVKQSIALKVCTRCKIILIGNPIKKPNFIIRPPAALKITLNLTLMRSNIAQLELGGCFMALTNNWSINLTRCDVIGLFSAHTSNLLLR